MGGRREDGFHSSTPGIVYQERKHNRQDTGFEEGLAERSKLGNADAHLLHKPGWTWAQRIATGRTRRGEVLAIEKDRAETQI